MMIVGPRSLSARASLGADRAFAWARTRLVPLALAKWRERIPVGGEQGRVRASRPAGGRWLSKAIPGELSGALGRFTLALALTAGTLGLVAEAAGASAGGRQDPKLLSVKSVRVGTRVAPVVIRV